MAKGKPPEPSFEAALKRLEEVLDSLEHGNLSLEEAMRVFEEGVQLVRRSAIEPSALKAPPSSAATPIPR